jgi:hypothetical protein
MKIGNAIKNILQADSTLNALIGTRIRPITGGQSPTLPFVTYRILGVDPVNTMDGPAQVDVTDVELTVFSEKYIEMHNIADQVRSVLDHYCGTAEGFIIDHCYYQGQREEFADSNRLYAHTVMFSIRGKNIVTQTAALAGVLNATATAVCQIQAFQFLQANANIAGSASTNMIIAKQLSVTLGAAATASCIIQLTNDLNATANITGSASLATTLAKLLTGQLNTSASASASITVQTAQLLAGNLTTTGAAFMASQILKQLNGSASISALAGVIIDVQQTKAFISETFTITAPLTTGQQTYTLNNFAGVTPKAVFVTSVGHGYGKQCHANGHPFNRFCHRAKQPVELLCTK